MKQVFYLKDNTIVKNRIELHAVGISLILSIHCFGSPCQVSISPEGTMQEEVFPIEDSAVGNSSGKVKLISNINSTTLIMKVLKLSTNLTHLYSNQTLNRTTKFMMEFFSTGCFYWRKEKNIWSSDGCKVENLRFDATFFTLDYIFIIHS